MPSELLLDVRGLAPPEPLERVLAALHGLRAEQYVRVQLHREPFPLYALLDETGFAWMTREGRDTPFEIFIWRRGDEHSQTAVQRLLVDDAGS